MAPKNVIIALFALCGLAYGQTRSLLVNPSGVVQYTNTVQWQGALSFGTNATAQAVTRSNLSLGLPALTNTTGAGLLSAIGGIATNGDAVGLTNFPSIVLQTNSSDASFPPFLLRTNGDALGLTNFPAELLRTNGDASNLTNFPTFNQNTTGTASNVTGVVEIANGGTGTNSAAGARIALELGTAATNDATAFQPASATLTNIASNDGGSLTNLAYSNMVGLGTAATNDASAFQLASTNLDSLASNNAVNLTNFSTSIYPVLSNNAAKVLAVTTNEAGVEWVAVSNTVTDASTLTNFPASILQTNSSDSSFPSFLLRTNGDGSGLTNLPFVGGASATNVGPIMASMNSLSSDTGTGGSITNIANGIWVIASLTNNSFAVARALMTPGLFVGSSTPLNFTNNFSFGMHLSSASTNFAQGNQRYYVGTEINYSTNDPTNVVLGWRVKDQTIYAAMHNGTSYSEPFSTNNVFETNGASYVWTWVEGDGTGSVSWYVNGELLGTATNGPTNRAYGRYLSVSAHNDTGSNTTSPTTARIVNFIYNFK